MYIFTSTLNSHFLIGQFIHQMNYEQSEIKVSWLVKYDITMNVAMTTLLKRRMIGCETTTVKLCSLLQNWENVL